VKSSTPVQSPNFPATCWTSEEFKRLKREEERKCLKETYEFLRLLCKKLHRSHIIVNTSMFFFLKYTRIYSFATINKFLVASACLLLGAKCQDEPIPIEFLVEWYIWCETKRQANDSKIDISEHKKQDYSCRIQEQEFDILCELGFDCEVDLPNKYISQFAASPIGKAIYSKFNIGRYATMFANDSFTTTCSLYYTPQQIAAASIYMASIYLTTSGKVPKLSDMDLNAPQNTEWYASIDETLDIDIITEVKGEIKKCYAKKTSSS